MNSLTACRVVFARWTVLLVALIAELLHLTVRFDAGGLTQADVLTDCIAHAKRLPEIAIAIAAALLVAGRARLRTSAIRLVVRAVDYGNWWLFAAVHLTAFSLLVTASPHVFEQTQVS